MRTQKLFLFLALALTASVASAGTVYINELYVDPPGSDDTGGRAEYVELRGDPGASLSGLYLVFVEGENTESMGTIQNMFDLTNFSFGSNGYLSIRMNEYTAAGTYSPKYTSASIDSDGNNLVQGGSTQYTSNYQGFGRGMGGYSTVGYQGEGDPERRDIENGIFTVLLINVGTGDVPEIGMDLDVEEINFGGGVMRYGDGVLDLLPGWSVVDSIGVELEIGEADGTVYGAVNFGCEDLPNRPAGSSFLDVNFGIGGVNDTDDDEIEYLARWGNSTGQTVDDWIAANLTNNPQREGYSFTTGEYLLSAAGDNHEGPVQCSQDLPYGTVMTNTIGGANIPEPATLSLLVMGGPGLLVRRKRR